MLFSAASKRAFCTFSSASRSRSARYCCCTSPIASCACSLAVASWRPVRVRSWTRAFTSRLALRTSRLWYISVAISPAAAEQQRDQHAREDPVQPRQMLHVGGDQVVAGTVGGGGQPGQPRIEVAQQGQQPVGDRRLAQPLEHRLRGGDGPPQLRHRGLALRLRPDEGPDLAAAQQLRPVGDDVEPELDRLQPLLVRLQPVAGDGRLQPRHLQRRLADEPGDVVAGDRAQRLLPLQDQDRGIGRGERQEDDDDEEADAGKARQGRAGRRPQGHVQAGRQVHGVSARPRSGSARAVRGGAEDQAARPQHGGIISSRSGVSGRPAWRPARRSGHNSAASGDPHWYRRDRR